MQTITAGVFKIYKFIHSLSLDVPLTCLCINDLIELCKRYPQLTSGYCIEMRSGTNTVHVFFPYEAISFIFQIYSFKSQIIVGSFGAPNVTKYLKLSKITNFLGQGPDAAQTIVVFHNFR